MSVVLKAVINFFAPNPAQARAHRLQYQSENHYNPAATSFVGKSH